LQVGKPLYKERNAIGGLFGGIHFKDLEQLGDKAEIVDLEAGAYGGFYSGNKIGVKANASLGFQLFNVERQIHFLDFNENPKSSFNTFSIKLNGQGEYKIIVDNEIDLKPYIALENAFVLNGEFQESAAPESALTVEGGTYFRSMVSAGLKLEDEKGALKWFLKAYGGYVLLGAQPSYGMRFANGYGSYMDIQARKIQSQFGGAAGVEYRATDVLSVHANADLSFADDFIGYYFNLGVNYKLGEIFKNRAEYQLSLKKKQSNLRAVEYRPLDVKTFRMLAAWFAVGKYDLTDDAKDLIRDAVNEIKNFEYRKITIEGHADSTGQEAKNKTLSIMRARAVYEELYNNGVPLDKMEYIEFFGSEEAVAPNDTTEGRARNRRVELVIDYIMDGDSVKRLNIVEEEEYERSQKSQERQEYDKKGITPPGIEVKVGDKIDVPQRQRTIMRTISTPASTVPAQVNQVPVPEPASIIEAVPSRPKAQPIEEEEIILEEIIYDSPNEPKRRILDVEIDAFEIEEDADL